MENQVYKNETSKRKFYKDLQHSQGYSSGSIRCFKKAIWLWQEFTNNDDFIYFNHTKVVDFKEWLKNKDKRASEVKISLVYRYDILRHLKLFFEWLSNQTGYKRINKTVIEYLNLTKGEVRIATQPKGQLSPTVEEVKKTIENITGKSEIEMRDKALFSLTFLTAARISAIASFPIGSFDRERLIIDQNPTLGVKTKNSKRFPTVLIPLFYKETLTYFLEWFDYLVNEKKFQPTDPIFPATKVENDKENLGYYNTEKVEPFFWKSSTSARKIFEKRFIQAGVKYYHPHTFRHLLVKEISKLRLTEEQKKAFSQNLGHADIGTTFGSYGYGHISEDRQVDIIKNIDFIDQKTEVKYQFTDDDLNKLAKKLKQND